MTGMKSKHPSILYINIIKVYWIFRMKSFNLSLLNKITAGMNGSNKILIGKKVIVTDENSFS